MHACGDPSPVQFAYDTVKTAAISSWYAVLLRRVRRWRGAALGVVDTPVHLLRLGKVADLTFAARACRVSRTARRCPTGARRTGRTTPSTPSSSHRCSCTGSGRPTTCAGPSSTCAPSRTTKCGWPTSTCASTCASAVVLLHAFAHWSLDGYRHPRALSSQPSTSSVASSAGAGHWYVGVDLHAQLQSAHVLLPDVVAPCLSQTRLDGLAVAFFALCLVLFFYVSYGSCPSYLQSCAPCSHNLILWMLSRSLTRRQNPCD